jgi:hypothetical protein
MTNPSTTVVPMQTARTGLRMLLVDSGGNHALRAAPWSCAPSSRCLPSIAPAGTS